MNIKIFEEVVSDYSNWSEALEHQVNEFAHQAHVRVRDIQVLSMPGYRGMRHVTGTETCARAAIVVIYEFVGEVHPSWDLTD